MSMEYLSIYLCLPFFSSKSYSFQCKNLFPSILFKFIPKYFIPFDAVGNGIAFLISLSDSWLLVYRNTTSICILILYPATLLNLFVSSNSFWVDSLGFSIYNIMSSANRDSFTSFFLMWIPFISFSCLVSLTRTANTSLNKSGES